MHFLYISFCLIRFLAEALSYRRSNTVLSGAPVFCLLGRRARI